MRTSRVLTGQCYCGAVVFNASAAPSTVSYCHCTDCRRLSGAPVAAFAAFQEGAVQFHAPLGPPVSYAPGVSRWFCASCGSQLAARYDYLPGQTYVPLGLIDQAEDFPPVMHCHADARLSWLHISDDLERHAGSGRNTLSAGQPPE